MAALDHLVVALPGAVSWYERTQLRPRAGARPEAADTPYADLQLIEAVAEREWALLLHLSGVVLLFSGMAVAAVAHEGARKRERAGEVAALLGLTRSGVVLVVAGTVVLLGSGLWLIEASNDAYSLGDGWIAGSLGLLALAVVVGAAGGQRPKRARKLANELTGHGTEQSEELRALLDDPLSLALNYLAAVSVAAALVLMVWKPGV